MEIRPAQRIFFLVLALSALLLAAAGLFFPQAFAGMLLWLQPPPLHARFIGSLYWFATLYMVGLTHARHRTEVRFGLLVAAVWTGMLITVSVLNIGAFDFSQFPAVLWFASYGTYPWIALAVAWPWRQSLPDDGPGPELPQWAKGFLAVQGGIFIVLALALLTMPGAAGAFWPWAITPFLAQTYGGPLLAFGLGSVLFAQRRSWLTIRPAAPAMLAFSLGTLISTFLHVNLFSFGELPDILWVVWFVVATAVLAVMTKQVLTLKV